MIEERRGSWFQRFLLPGLAFKAVVIGGGYATGRELAEFFLPGGPRGGLAAMLLVTLAWSGICAITFALATRLTAHDYRSFFRALLGRLWPAFEAAYLLFVVLILAVFGAAAGAIGEALLNMPAIVGTTLLALLIGVTATYGNHAVERLFKWVSALLYATYAVFLILALTRFGGRIDHVFASAQIGHDWLAGGFTYASYNVVGAVIILPALRHLTDVREAAVAGLIAGPLAMLPAVAFFVAMIGFYPGIAQATLPSDVILNALELPFFHILFQAMIFCALLESGTGSVHAINERIDAVWRVRYGAALPRRMRALSASLILIGCVFVASRFGLVALIARGYRLLAWIIFGVYVVPLLTLGMRRLLQPSLVAGRI